MKKIIRNWLGISREMELIDQNFQTAEAELREMQLNIYKMFHSLPFVASLVSLNAEDAARLTMPNGIETNNPFALLTGILMGARQGESYLQLDGELSEDVRTFFTNRGFKVEDQGDGDGKVTFIIWA